MTPIEKKLTKARISLLTNQAFFGTLALRLRLVEMEPEMIAFYEQTMGKATMAVDGKKIFYNPAFINELSHNDLMFVLAHEVGHCIFEHIGRRGDRDKQAWNTAGDYVINAALKEAGMDFQHEMGCFYNPQWGTDKTADWVYNQLPKGGKGNGPGNQPGGQGNQPGQSPLCDILDGESKKDPTLQDDWKIATAQAAASAHQAGKLPASMKRFVDELLNPKTDWRTQLRRFVTEVTKSDYSWQRPNRKMLGAHGVYLPSLYSERMGTIAIAVDTSGSITREMLNIFASEINAIRAAVMPEKTIVIYCDAQVNKVVEFTAEDYLELEMVGGGGTDFRPVTRYIEKHGIRPACLCFLTDLYGPYDAQPPEYPFMWCVTTDQVPTWGERVQIDMEG